MSPTTNYAEHMAKRKRNKGRPAGPIGPDNYLEMYPGLDPGPAFGYAPDPGVSIDPQTIDQGMHSREQALRNVMGQMDGPRQTQRFAEIGRGTMNRPEFAYPGNPNRNPFEMPLAAVQQAAQGPQGPALDARGVQIPPQILAAMDRMRTLRDQPGIQTDGEQAQADFLARGGARRSTLWG